MWGQRCDALSSAGGPPVISAGGKIPEVIYRFNCPRMPWPRLVQESFCRTRLVTPNTCKTWRLIVPLSSLACVLHAHRSYDDRIFQSLSPRQVVPVKIWRVSQSICMVGQGSACAIGRPCRPAHSVVLARLLQHLRMSMLAQNPLRHAWGTSNRPARPARRLRMLCSPRGGHAQGAVPGVVLPE